MAGLCVSVASHGSIGNLAGIIKNKTEVGRKGVVRVYCGVQCRVCSASVLECAPCSVWSGVCVCAVLCAWCFLILWYLSHFFSVLLMSFFFVILAQGHCCSNTTMTMGCELCLCFLFALPLSVFQSFLLCVVCFLVVGRQEFCMSTLRRLIRLQTRYGTLPTRPVTSGQPG